MEKKSWISNITRRMVVIWAVSFVAVVALLFGIFATTMALIRVDFGKQEASNLDNTLFITFMNENGATQLSNWNFSVHRTPAEAILNKLSTSGRSNQLTSLFRAQDQHVTNTFTTTTGLASQHSRAGIQIRFRSPAFTVVNTDSAIRWQLQPRTEENRAQGLAVHEIFIPLNRAENRFQEQSWYLLTRNPNTASGGTSLTITHRLVTYGNYHALGNFIQDLVVRG